MVQFKTEEKLYKKEIQLLKESQDDLKKEMESLSKENEELKSINKSIQNKYEHTVKRGVEENRQLNEKLKKNCGKYIPVDHCIAEEIQNYKRNEELYKDTILTLQQNNEGLLNEILNLKEEIIYSSISSKMKLNN